MRETIPFGEKFIEVELPDRTTTYKSSWIPGLPPVKDLNAEMKRALSKPLGSPRIQELVKKGSQVTIAFDDPTVPSFGSVRGVAIKCVLEELRKAGVQKKDVTLLCASGLHRRWTRMEMGRIIGEDTANEFGYRLICHDAEDKENIVYLGRTGEGHDVEVHKLAVESDLTIYVNASCMRGLTGGWKSVLVGLGTYKTIRWHHGPDGLSASVHNNPLHKILDEMALVLEKKAGKKRFFKIETILSNPFEVARVFAGNTWETRKAALKILTSFAPKPGEKPEPADIVVYGIPAYSPYATFAKMNPILTLFSTGLGYFGGSIESAGKKGCTVIMATPCPNSWDEVHHAAYREVWEKAIGKTKDPYELRDQFEDDFANRHEYIYKYRFCYSFHPVHGILASYPLRRLKHVGKVMVAGAEDSSIIKHAGFEPAPTVEDAVAKAQELHGPGSRITLINNLVI